MSETRMPAVRVFCSRSAGFASQKEFSMLRSLLVLGAFLALGFTSCASPKAGANNPPPQAAAEEKQCDDAAGCCDTKAEGDCATEGGGCCSEEKKADG